MYNYYLLIVSQIFLRSVGYSRVEASIFTTTASISGLITNIILGGRLFKGKLICFNIFVSIGIAELLLVWPFISLSDYSYFILSLFFGVFHTLTRIYNYPCCVQIMAFDEAFALSSTTLFIALGSLLSPFFAGMLGWFGLVFEIRFY